jgi:hypothetical protein
VGLLSDGLLLGGLFTAVPLASAQAAPTSNNGTTVTKTIIPLHDLAPVSNLCAPGDGLISFGPNPGQQVLMLQTFANGTTLADLKTTIVGTAADGTPYRIMRHVTTPQPITLVDYKETQLWISQGPSPNMRIDNVGQGNVVTCFGDDSATLF